MRFEKKSQMTLDSPGSYDIFDASLFRLPVRKKNYRISALSPCPFVCFIFVTTYRHTKQFQGSCGKAASRNDCEAGLITPQPTAEAEVERGEREREREPGGQDEDIYRYISFAREPRRKSYEALSLSRSH